MKTITVVRRGLAMTITAPENKDMVINDAALANGILSIGEWGPSGVKIASFSDWDEVVFDAEDYGYTITREDVPAGGA